MRSAIVGQPGIHCADILVQQSIETARPRLRHTTLTKPCSQLRGFVSNKTPEGPSRQIDIPVDHAFIPFAASIGVSIRFRFSPRINRRASSVMFAPITLPNCEPKLRPPTSLP